MCRIELRDRRPLADMVSKRQAHDVIEVGDDARQQDIRSGLEQLEGGDCGRVVIEIPGDESDRSGGACEEGPTVFATSPSWSCARVSLRSNASRSIA